MAASTPSPIRRRLSGPLLMLGLLVALFLVAELGLLVFSPVPDPLAELEARFPFVNQYIRMEYPRDFTIETTIEDGLPGLSGHKLFTTNNMGLRGDDMKVPKPANEFRIIMIGGSTTECGYLDDDEAITAILQNALGQGAPAGVSVRVYGAGFSGAASDDHVAYLVNRAVHLQPDMVVLFAGINDLTRGLFGFDYMHFTDRTPPLHVRWLKRFALRFQIGRRLYYLRRQMAPGERARQERISFKSDYADKVELRKSVPVTTDAVARVDSLPFERNLRSFIGAARANGVSVVMMTQASSWNSDVDPSTSDYQWMTLRDGVTYPEMTLDAALESLNDVTRRVGHETGVPVYDLAATLPKSTDYLYDDCHFNILGARTAGDGLARFILSRDLLR